MAEVDFDSCTFFVSRVSRFLQKKCISFTQRSENSHATPHDSFTNPDRKKLILFHYTRFTVTEPSAPEITSNPFPVLAVPPTVADAETI